MAVITPVGKVDFDWSPREHEEKQMVKTASANDKNTGAKKGAKKVVAEKTDKDLLYEVAKKIVEAQFEETEAEETEEVGEKAEEAGEEAEEAGEEAEVADLAEKGAEGEGGEGAVGDVQEAVAELVEKAESADEMVEKVEEAVQAVETAITGVRDAVGGTGGAEVGGEEAEFAEIDIPDDDTVELDLDIVDAGDKGGAGLDGIGGCGCDKGNMGDMGNMDEGGEDIIQESRGAMASIKSDLKKVAKVDDFVKTSKISPSVQKKIKDYWKNQLGYVSDYCDLMVVNSEK